MLELNLDRFPEKLPFGLQKFKAEDHMVLTFEAVDFVINSKNVSSPLLRILNPYPHPHESLFSVLQFNPRRVTGFPGGFEQITRDMLDRNTSVRHKLWFVPCASRFNLRGICITGVNDLPIILKDAYQKNIAINNFKWDFQPRAWDCFNLWHYEKMKSEYKTGRTPFDPRVFFNKPYFKFLNLPENGP